MHETFVPCKVIFPSSYIVTRPITKTCSLNKSSPLLYNFSRELRQSWPPFVKRGIGIDLVESPVSVRQLSRKPLIELVKILGELRNGNAIDRKFVDSQNSFGSTGLFLVLRWQWGEVTCVNCNAHSFANIHLIRLPINRDWWCDKKKTAAYLVDWSGKVQTSEHGYSYSLLHFQIIKIVREFDFTCTLEIWIILSTFSNARCHTWWTHMFNYNVLPYPDVYSLALTSC